MKRSFRIEFIRKADEWEMEHMDRNASQWYDDEAGYVYDSTEFDTDGQTMEEMFVGLINLFNGFCDENKFEDVTVTEIEEVPYDGEG